jgi:hypothetical protein
MYLVDDDDFFEEVELELIRLAKEHRSKMRGFSKAQRMAAIGQIAADCDCCVAVLPIGNDYQFMVVKGQMPDGTTASSANAFWADDEDLAHETRRRLMH